MVGEREGGDSYVNFYVISAIFKTMVPLIPEMEKGRAKISCLFSVVDLDVHRPRHISPALSTPFIIAR